MEKLTLSCKVFILAILLAVTGFAKFTHESYFIYGKENLKYFAPYKELTVDHVSSLGFEVYGPRGLGNYILKTQVRFVNLNQNKQKEAFRGGYATPEQVAQRIQNAIATNPNIAKMFSIGKSVKGRDLWVVKLSKNVSFDDNRPEFKYIANMHGDEIIGRELMVLLIEDLIANYGKDSFITDLLDKTQIYILPSMNPDGAQAVTRGNANHVDLNRDFPDFSTSDNQNTIEGRALETQLVMKWQSQRKFLLSANFHGGAEVISYPWDTVPEKFPLHDAVKSLSLEYSANAPYIGASKVFPQGIVNGYNWYEVDGGMQDWSFNWYKDIQITIELSNEKYPNPNKVSYYYQQNRKALLTYIARVHTINQSRWIVRNRI
ncbi:MAG: DUF2817 domain-containing protein [Bdellovibrionaceae bacterium]|nr:DUF2817 domain-containing protein [Pseudobdellovibrionaceae bacterium]